MKITLMPYTGPSESIRKIEVIKQIRTITGIGLKEAKEIADDLFVGIQRDVVSAYSESEPDFVSAINILKECSIKVEIDSARHNALKDLKNITKQAIAICTEHDEAELLEIYAVAFKVLCE